MREQQGQEREMEEEGLTQGQREHLETLIGLLDKGGLLELRGLVDSRLAELEEGERPAEAGCLSSSCPVSISSPGGNGTGWVELKMINGFGPYAYKRWREGKTLRSKYLGKVKQSAS